MLSPYFHYSSYWGTYSRVLHSPGRKHANVELPKYETGAYIEVDLTPINGWPHEDQRKMYGDKLYAEHVQYQLNQVRFVNIRSHGTRRDAKDEILGCLPANVIEQMKNNLDHSLVNFLLTGNILPLIDWNKYRKVCNGGASLKDCIKDDLEQELKNYFVGD